MSDHRLTPLYSVMKSTTVQWKVKETKKTTTKIIFTTVTTNTIFEKQQNISDVKKKNKLQRNTRHYSKTISYFSEKVATTS